MRNTATAQTALDLADASPRRSGAVVLEGQGFKRKGETMNVKYVVTAHGISVLASEALKTARYNHQISRRDAERLVGSVAIQQAWDEITFGTKTEVYVPCGKRPHPVDLGILM